MLNLELMKTALLFFTVIFASTQLFGQGISRTFTYNQITNFSESPVGGQDWQHVLSDNGNKVVWFKQTNPKKVFVINPDGSGMLELDDLESDRLTEVDITEDGSKVVYVGGPFAGGSQVNIINSDGSGYQMLIALTGLHIKTIRITADGNKVFFCVYTNSTIAGGGGAIERGVYSINPDGTGLTQVVGPAEVATSLGIPVADVGPFYGGSNGPAIDVSHDGAEIVFMAKNEDTNDHYVFTANSGITNVNGPFQWLNAVGISSDGSKVAMSVNDAGNHEGWVCDYDGSGLSMVASNDDLFYFSNGSSKGDQINLTANGSLVLFDFSGHLISTSDGSVLSLAANTLAGAGWPMILEVQRATMNKSGTRVLFSFAQQPTGYQQLAILDIEPTSLGMSPQLSNITMDANAAVPGGQSSAMSLLVTPSNGSDSIRYAGNVCMKNGFQDAGVDNSIFYDNGSSAGDLVADDGIYTNNNVFAFSNAELGPRTMRFNSEVYDSNLMLHGTAVETSTTFHVVDSIDQVGVEDFAESTIGLYPITPNPVVGNSIFTYHLADKSWVELAVFDPLGRKIDMLDRGNKRAGNWRVEWSPKSDLGNGVYTLRLIADGEVDSRQFIISK